MKDRILQSYLHDFCKEEGIDDLKEPDAFERFVNYCIVAREHTDSFDLEHISIGGGNDIGLDGVAILVNDRLVYSEEDINYFKTTIRRFDVKFIFIQSKTSTNFDMGEIGTFLFGVKSFFTSSSALIRNEAIQYLQKLREFIYSASIDMDQPPECLMFYATTGTWQNDPNLQARIDAGINEFKQTNLFSTIKFTPIDAESLKDLYKELKRKIVTEVSFEKHTILPKIDKVQEAYIGILPCQEYIKLIVDKDDKLRRNLFDDNVRDYQGNNPVNDEITATVKDASQNDRFTLLNNGITIVAASITKVGASFKLRDYQIVNGCQTSHVLYLNRNYLTNQIYVPIKLIVTDNIEVTNQIIRATNRQTTVNPEAFESLSPFHKNLEEFYSSFGKDKPIRLYYERRSKQYDALPIKKEQIITLTGQLKSFLSMFLNEPHSTHRYYGELLKAYRSKIFVEGHNAFPYYLSGYAFNTLENAFTQQVIDRKFKPFRFQLLMLFRLLAEPSKLPYLNNPKIEVYCEKLFEGLNDTDYFHDTFHRATTIIENSLKQGNYGIREATRIKAFTTHLISSAKVDGSDDIADVKRNEGTVLWFSAVKGYGFITCKDLDKDIYIHFNDIAEQGYKFPTNGQKVEFTLVETKMGWAAKDLRIVK